MPADEARRLRNERRLRALGIARARGPECPVEPWDVGDGRASRPWSRASGAPGGSTRPQLGQPFAGRTALLSPFDRLVHDRKRTVELFEFDYQLEMYKPAAKRRWGYFALPILSGDRLVGKLDATADRKAGVLRVDAIHEDEPFDKPHDRRRDARDRRPGPLARAGDRAAGLTGGPLPRPVAGRLRRLLATEERHLAGSSARPRRVVWSRPGGGRCGAVVG